MTRIYYPMQLSGGAFLICTGVALAVSALIVPTYIGWVVVAGFVTGFVAVRATIPAARARWGAPLRTQLRFFRAALALEFGAFGLIVLLGLFRGRPFTLIMEMSLAIVALHFFVMRWSHGPLIACLGAAMLCWTAFAAVMKLTLPALLLGNGLLMVGFGLIMAYPLFQPVTPAPSGA